MKKRANRLRILSVAVLTVAANAHAQNNLWWTGGSGTTNGWSETVNWTNAVIGSSYTPPLSNIISFSTFTVTNPPQAVGVIDNVVDADVTVSGISFVEDAAHAHTTLINPGVTLTLSQYPGLTVNLIAMGNVTTDNAAQVNWTIIGTNGARLVAGNPAAPDIANQIVISERFNSTTPFTQRGTLDLGRLDDFTFAGGIFQVGSNPSSGKDWPRGRIVLARTNLIIAAQTTTPSIKVGHLAGSGTGGDGDLQLGQTNAILAYSMRVGGVRASSGTLKFQAGLDNPALFLRGPDGVSSVTTIGIGDSSDQTANVNATATGVADFTGGTVDAYVNELFVGRNLNTVANTTGHGNGTLTWTAGLIEVVTLNIGAQGGNNRGNATGTVNVRSNATLKVNTFINIGSDAGANTGGGNGTLNIADGGTVTVLGDLSENTLGIIGRSTVNLTNGSLTTGGLITVDSINFHSGNITNVGMLTVSNLLGAGTIHGPTTVIGNLAPGNSIGTLTISNDLTLSATSTNVFEVNIDTLAHDVVAGINNLTYGGTLVISPSGFGAAITNGAAVRIFEAQSYAGAFSAILPAAPAPGFGWVTSGLTNGVLAIEATVSLTRTNLAFAQTAGGLEVSWPASHTGWRLEAQTNGLGVGISSNWFTVPGSTTTNLMSFPVNFTNGSVFYRMVFP